VKKKIQALLRDKRVIYPIITILLLALVVGSNLYLQWCQNNLSWDLAFKFAFSWHAEKFFLGCFVLAVLLLFFISLAGSVGVGTLLYSLVIGILGYADYMKMTLRQEPIYPDDLKMITELGLLKEMAGTGPFILIMALSLAALSLFGWGIYKSFKKPRHFQVIRGTTFILSIALFFYISNFNNPNNLLRKEYNKTALWIPYSQKMNYYNTGFIGGFLYNLKVDPMDKPAGYSKEKVEEITKKYKDLAKNKNKTRTQREPNIIYIMSESFSDPSRLNGLTISGDPLADYYEMANQTYSGNMLSQNYGGGTANIEFEALTSFSMELMNPQMTTPYTMLVPKMTEFPSLVSVLKDRNYQTTAIHPYNTSMYKRKDVYNVFGFDQFLDEDTMTYTDTIQKNPYISDAAAYKEVMDILKDDSTPQFIHLVTMQTHMPYSGKYTALDYQASGEGNMDSLQNYLQDVSYSSQALKTFLNELKKVDRQTLVVFWGDHLPGIYSDEIQAANDESTLHETQFLMYDNKGNLTNKDNHQAITSPFYFAGDLMEQSNLPTTGFYQLVNAVQETLPAFERNLYFQNGQWQKEIKLTKDESEAYEAYQMIQYDIVAGNQYSLSERFFKE
jgi:phosphoglycerol transferase MdoB-like AlkP superfamily enzyme